MSIRRTCLEVAEAAGLQRGHERSGEVYFKAPCHDDQRPSLRIHSAKDCFKCDPCNLSGNAWELMALIAKCDPSDKKAVLAWRDAHHLGNGNGNGNGSAHKREERHIVAVYDYQTALRKLAFQTVRYSPKDFKQRRPNSNGGFIYSLDGVERVLFRLPELLEADPSLPVFIPEGEKDVLAIAERGGIATCNAMGAGKWRDDYSASLRGRHCIVLHDNDGPGREHGRQVAASLVAHGAASVKILDLPGLPPKGDVSNWFEAGGTLAQLQQLAEETPLFRPSEPIDTQPHPSIVRLADVKPESVEWLWESRLPRGKMTLFIGDPGAGKSSTALDVASRITRGALWPDGGRAPIGNVILLSAEDGLADTVRPRVDAYGGDPSRIFALQGVRHTNGTETYFSLDEDLSQLEKAIGEIGYVLLIVIDPLSAYLGDIDTHKDAEIRRVLGPLALLAERHRIAILGVMHLTKNSQVQAIYRAQGSIAFIAAARAVFCVGKDPDNEDRRVLAHVKGNLSAPPPSLAFEFVGGRIEWQSTPVNLSAQDLLSPANSEERSEQQDVEEFLRDLLSDGSMHSKEVFKATHENNFSETTVKRAKRQLGIESIKIGQPGSKNAQWNWSLPASSEPVVSRDSPIAVVVTDEVF